MKIVDCIRPGTLPEAQRLLQELGEKGLPVAGATALHFMTGKLEKVAVDLRDLGLAGIRSDADVFTIGAMTTISDLNRFSGSGWVLHGPSCCLATQQVRNQSTLGGNISRVFPWCDFPVILMALDGTIVCNDNGTENPIGADEFFKGQPASRLTNGCLVTAVKVPSVKPPFGFGYRKQRRTASGFSLMTAVCNVEVDGDSVQSARVAAGGALPYPRRLPELEQALVGVPAEKEALAECVARLVSTWTWKGQEGETDEYATQLAKVLLSDALSEAAELAKGGAR